MIAETVSHKIADFLSAEDILLDLPAADKAELFDFIGRHMEKTHGLPAEMVARSLSRREQVGSTGLGYGIAIPHARIGGLDRILGFYARLRSPIPFQAPDGKPVLDVLALLVPAPGIDQHLLVLAEATQMFASRRFRHLLHACSGNHDVLRLFSAQNPPD
jgi:PTS system nitrogen regulatory IIA component